MCKIRKQRIMKIIGIIILTTVTLFSCSTKQNQSNKFGSVNNRSLDKLTFSVYDSLIKYSSIDSILIPFKVVRTGWTIDTSSTRILDKDGNPPDIEFCDTIDAFLYKGIANNIHFGLTLKDAKIVFYQKMNDTWIITDTTDFFEPISIKQMDLNGDGFKDLRISTPYNKENGDILTCVFLYYDKTKSFKLNTSFGQANIEYDNKNHFVKFWIGCIKGQRGVKWRGSVDGDYLKVDSTITFSINTDKNSGNKVGILELYEGPNGASHKPITSEVGNPDSLWLKFSKTFWTSNE